jgi:hypothetical protein
MTPAQKRKHQRLESRLGQPQQRAIEHSMAALLNLVAPEGSQIEIRSDEHPAYPRTWRRAPRVEVRHAVTPSKKARTARNPLFPVNCADLWLRHSGANHKRETIAFPSAARVSSSDAFILSVYLSNQKSFSEKKPTGTEETSIQKGPLRHCFRVESNSVSQAAWKTTNSSWTESHS